MKKITIILLFLGVLISAQKSEYKFFSLIDLAPTPVLNQGQTGTCWSFSTTSFLESEVKRISGKNVDLSEMYPVRVTYPYKAYNYVYRHGKATFDEGGLSHDVMNVVKNYGIVPSSVFEGSVTKNAFFDHRKMVKDLTQTVEEIVKNPKENLVVGWEQKVENILDANLGTVPEKFDYEGTEYTPKTFAKYLEINPNDYVTLTSFTHHPYYETFILEIPDNFSNGNYYNLPLDEYVSTLSYALNQGFTVALDTDVTEKSFSAEQGLAIWPSEGTEKDYFNVLLPEKWVSETERQQAFENYSTEDDHLMHITGLLKEQIGNQYLDVKNSWGTSNLGNGGHVYMSIPYFRMKSIAYTVHKDAIPTELRQKLGIL